MKAYDVAVVGGGPGGYVAAIRAAKEGKSVALIERDHLGGTCLNRGCIPSKTLLRHAEVIEAIGKAKAWGIETGELRLSLDKMMARKDQVVNRLRAGIASLLQAGRVHVYRGTGTVYPDKTIGVDGSERADSVTVQAGSVILATGSAPYVPPIPGLSEVTYYTSDTIFDIGRIPESLAIVGGGFIGVEFACVFHSLGAQVTIVEMADRLLPNEDADAGRALEKALRKKGVTILTGTKVEAVSAKGEEKHLRLSRPSGEASELACADLLVAVGRKPSVTGIEELKLAMNGPYVAVDEYLQTSAKGIYAVGDLIGGWQLAHAASAEGIVAAVNACGGRRKVDYRAVPRCVYTLPEIAAVGLTEEAARQQGYRVKTAVYRLAANGKALAMDESDGFVKLIADERFGEILGAVMAGPHVTELIAQVAAFMHLEGTVDELAGMMFPHPTVSESLMEAAADWLGKGIHSL